jgi:hypothetical protein
VQVVYDEFVRAQRWHARADELIQQNEPIDSQVLSDILRESETIAMVVKDCLAKLIQLKEGKCSYNGM